MKVRLLACSIGFGAMVFAAAEPVSGQSPPVNLAADTEAAALPSTLGPSATAKFAASYGFSEAEFRQVVARERSMRADRSGRLYYACHGLVVPVGSAFGDDGAVTQTNYPPDQTFLLASRPGAVRTIYLDFDGHETAGTAWNTSFNGGAAFTTPPYDIDGNPSSFSTTELARIQGIWKRVAEDFMPYDVNVTTLDPGVEALRRSGSQDSIYGIRVAIGGSSMDWYGKSAGGVAYLGAFNWSSDTPCYVFTAQLGNGNEKYTAEAASHEAGHTLGLQHDGTTNNVEYYQGHANWAPIMGVGYYREVTQWSRGEYPQANNPQDDLAVMTAYGAPLRADDHSDVIIDATPIDDWRIAGAGVISSRQDADLFRVLSGKGFVTFAATPAQPSPNLDIHLSLYDGLGGIVGIADPAGMGCSLSVDVDAGVYYLAVEGTGAGSPLTSYNDYASIGEYSLSGVVVPSGLLAPIAIASADVTSGGAPLTVHFSGVESYDEDGSVEVYDWDFGDETVASGPNPVKTYGSPGVYLASLVVVDDDGLASAASSVEITVTEPPPPPNYVRVASITMSKSVKRGSANVTATVKVTDAAGKTLQGAAVLGQWSGIYNGAAGVATTSRKGTASFKASSIKGEGGVTFTVTGVSLSGYTYDPSLNGETSDSISVP